MDRARAIVVQHPYRILANSMTVAAYRNGPVEELHAGRASGYAMNRRRATDQQSRELMRFTSERLAAVLSGFRPWKRHSGHPWSWPENLAGIYISPYLSPGNRSLCELSCPIHLGAHVRVLSCIEDPPVVRRILDHLGLWDACKRAPPAQPTATESIRGGVLLRVAEDPYPYDQTGWASDEPA